ncbi:hypothetical protein CE195_12020 [Sodalis-like symbiont of Philaenus spumarius]|nr:hypothetical protein CE195_12020 [Sodalis-like symbiont of Philaenus spumarius]
MPFPLGPWNSVYKCVARWSRAKIWHSILDAKRSESLS